MKKFVFGLVVGILLSWLILLVSGSATPNLNSPGALPSYLSSYSLPAEVASPADHIPQSDIHVLDGSVIIDIEDPEWAMFTDTNSMDPVLDAGANAIEIVPKSESQIQVGDIVSYKSEYADGTIIHRVVEINQDEDGWYARMKGDNNPSIDPGKVRFGQIQRLVVAVVY